MLFQVVRLINPKFNVIVVAAVRVTADYYQVRSLHLLELRGIRVGQVDHIDHSGDVMPRIGEQILEAHIEFGAGILRDPHDVCPEDMGRNKDGTQGTQKN